VSTLAHRDGVRSAREAALIAGALRLESIGGGVLRWGLVAILLYFGTFKFTAVEAAAIRPLVENSPLMSWLYSVLSEQAVSNLIGAGEIFTAGLIAARSFSPRLAIVGGLLGAVTFAITLSFLFSTPDSWASVPGFPLPLPKGGSGFILKDLFLLGASLWTAGEAARAVPERL
jgi:reactive chlorine resistance protein C